MKDREFRKLKGGTARAALAVCGWLGLMWAVVGPVRAQETGGTNGQSGRVVSADLDYREVNYSFVSWGAPLGDKAPVFKKEPVMSGRRVVRGTLRLGDGTSEEMGFVWDRTAGKLYLDLNRNLDLTDDPVWVCPLTRYYGDNYQSFTNIHLPFKTAAGTRQMLVDINLYHYGQPNCQVAMRSFWQGKVTLQGEEWQVGLMGNPFEQQGSLESGNLLLRRWSERNRPFACYTGRLEAVPFSQKLFVGDHAYQLHCTNEVQGGVGKVRMEFAEQEPKLGELKVTGQFMERVTLGGGPYLVVLDKPEATVKVPVGRYTSASVLLKKGGVEARLDGPWQAAAGKITVAEKAPAVLNVGGPLTNSVSISRGGRNLNLGYQLVGAGGSYQMVNQDRAHPPEFTVYQGDKKVGAGKFEFG
jgi:hypothetical protein